MGLVLFLVSLILLGLIGFISFVVTLCYFLITFKWETGYNKINKHAYQLALSVDQFGNVLCAVPFGYLFIKKFGIPFGDKDKTISYIIAVNRDRGTLTWLGRALGYILDVLDTDHLDKAIKFQIEDDRKAYERYKEHLSNG